jgi:hypothetical protein
VPTTDASPVIDTSERLAAAGFGALAALRRGRAVHTVGAGFAARFEVEAPWRSRWPAEPGAEATVRLSRGAGLPDAVPDILGIGVRVPGAGDEPAVDLLAASSGAAVGLRHVLRPARYFDAAFFSSLLPFAVDGRPLLYGFRVSGALRLTMGDLRGHHRPVARLDLVVATPSGPWEVVATLIFARWLDDDVIEPLALEPAGGGPFEPYGPLLAVARVRDAAYRASRRMRGAPEPAPAGLATVGGPVAAARRQEA